MVAIKTEYIKLWQFMKFAGIVNTGGEAKILLSEADITVNGEAENRPGRKLYPNDVVIIDGRKYVIEWL